MTPTEDEWANKFKCARSIIDRIVAADKDYGLGCEVLLQALDELDIDPAKFDEATWNGECEWIK